MCVYVWVYLYVYVYVHVCVYLCMSMCVCVCMCVRACVCVRARPSPPGDLEKKYEEVTLHTIIAVVQAVGFFNSFNNPIVYAFMNDNFKKSCVSTLSLCLRKRGAPGRGHAAAANAAVGPAANLIVHFRPLRREAFLKTADGSENRHGDDGGRQGPSGSSHGCSSLEVIGDKASTMQSQLPGSSSGGGGITK